MSNNQKYAKKDFSLGQYYNQLEKYEGGLSNSKTKPLRKDNSTSSFSKETFSKDVYKSSIPSKLHKETIHPDKQKILINDKPAQKTILEKFDRINLEIYKKNKVNDQRKINSYLTDSLENSKISMKKWVTENGNEEKENTEFSTKEEKSFTDHCSNLYHLRPTPTLVDDIAREINKRDEVYQLVANQLPNCPQEKYPEALEDYFKEFELMQKIIGEFKAISKLQTQDLNELYYFLKTDR